MAGNEAVMKSPHHCNKEVEKSDELDVNDSSSSMAATLFFHILRTFETIPSVIWSESLTVGRKEKKKYKRIHHISNTYLGSGKACLAPCLGRR